MDAQSHRPENPAADTPGTPVTDTSENPATGAPEGTAVRGGGHPWAGFLLRRLGGLLAVLVTLVVVTFLIVQLIPGDPARALAGPDATPQQIEQLRHEIGLDRPLPEQFASYAGGLLGGDLGVSFQTREPVADVIAARLPFTAELALLAVVVALAVAVPLGMAVAVATRGGRRPRLDAAFTFVTGLGGAAPEYVLGTLLVLVFAIGLGVLPASGAATLSALVLPVTAIALPGACVLARVVRREAAVVLEQDYMRTARGRRLPAPALYARHALPNLLTGTLTLGGLTLSALLGGTVIVESVFAWPGMGTRVVEAILARDYPVIQGTVLVLGLLAALINMIVDVLLGLLDPRTLAGRSHA
ncbi:peptide ABC transporter permease [Planobispora longispora]|uniref:Peptide ABC transporter permease n=1 Tax=Planobispora longispora TaxID=28887 RepID=A0A8J3RU22_9ACTN|nr:peptide ABC transporter permease [Planobispora longispora]